MNGLPEGLLYNSALLLSLSVINEISYIIKIGYSRIYDVIKGIIIGFIGAAIMAVPFVLSQGIVFDTRTVLISVAALTFGPFTAVPAAVITIIYRILEGGAGTVTGISTIIVSLFCGLLWRKLFLKKIYSKQWIHLYILGLVTHVLMLLCMFIMPYEIAVNTVKVIFLPVMIIYPFAAFLLGFLLIQQKQRNEGLLKVADLEERYRSLFHNNHSVMLIIDPADGKIIDANPAAAAFYGYGIDELKSMYISNINILGETAVKEKRSNALKEQLNYFVFKHRKKNGFICDVEVYSGPISYGKNTYLYSIVYDISEKLKIIEDLRESEQRFRLLVENAPEAIYIQTEGRFVFLNKFAIKLFGAKDASDLLGTDIFDRFHSDFHNAVKDRVDNLVNKNSTVPILEEIYVRLDGSFVDVEVNAVPMIYENNPGALVFARDITERKTFERRRIDMEAQLRQQQKLEAIGTLAGGVAHEINNPLNGILNYAELISDLSEKDSEALKYTREIINETDRISEIVRNLLQFSRQEKQTHSYANIYDIINGTMSLINTIIKRDQIELNINIQEGLPDIKCRSQQIQQVIMNLLTNAKDALNEKYPGYNEDKVINFSCSAFNEEARRWIRIIVEDYGCGISDEYLEKIYEPFFSTKPKESGTGLGLSISFGIVKDHHGRLYARSEKGSFTKFYLELPVDNGWEL